MSSREISLYELNRLLKEVVRDNFPDRYWIRAELSEVRENYSGHCYLELIEKESVSGKIIAKAKAMIWVSTYRMLKPYFEAETGQPFEAGLKVLVEVSLDFHELYGYTITIHDIDPVYTLGDMARKRQEILARLTEEGIIDMNRELDWPELPQRIAVISSKTAAGYGDFTDQLHHNKPGYVFYSCLFPAIMQGDQSEESIINALNRIYEELSLFDVVVIIRGGGATSDLSCFDSYLLATNIAQFPLPVISGIGHDRDETVIDRVAHSRVKTPTAAAAFLIDKLAETHLRLDELQHEFSQWISDKLSDETQRLATVQQWLPHQIDRLLKEQQSRLSHLAQGLKSGTERLISGKKNRLDMLARQIAHTSEMALLQQNFRLVQISQSMKQQVFHTLDKKKLALSALEQLVTLNSPQNILNKGYSLTLKNGKIIKSATMLSDGDQITTWLAHGKIESVISKIEGVQASGQGLSEKEKNIKT